MVNQLSYQKMSGYWLEHLALNNGLEIGRTVMQLDKDLQNQPVQELVWIISQEIPQQVAQEWVTNRRTERLEYLIQEYRNSQKKSP